MSHDFLLMLYVTLVSGVEDSVKPETQNAGVTARAAGA
jgi:hypothetical protein